MNVCVCAWVTLQWRLNVAAAAAAAEEEAANGSSTDSKLKGISTKSDTKEAAAVEWT